VIRRLSPRAVEGARIRQRLVELARLQDKSSIALAPVEIDQRHWRIGSTTGGAGNTGMTMIIAFLIDAP